MNRQEYTDSKSFNDFSIKQNGITINFRALIAELLDKAVLILLGGILCGLIFGIVYQNLIGESYVSETKIYVLPQTNEDELNYVDLEVGSQLTSDCMEVIQGRRVVEETIEHFQLEDNYKDYLKKINVETSAETRIISISVEEKNPIDARNEAEFLRDTAIKEIQSGMGVTDGITVIEPANLPVKPVMSAFVMGILLGFISVFLIAAFVVARYLIVDRIVSAEDVETRLNLTVLSSITSEEKK